jgi:hypothetical protein
MELLTSASPSCRLSKLEKVNFPLRKKDPG